jgi:Zn-finger nucleic acid-binding protein
MAEVPVIPAPDKAICLDVCTRCHFVWFDPREFEALPKLQRKPSDLEGLSEEGKKALALAQLEMVREEHALRGADDDTGTRWAMALEAICALLDILIRR